MKVVEDDKIMEDSMHGSIFVLLKRFVEHRYNYSTWVDLVQATGLEDATFQMQEMYPTKDLFSIVRKASESTGIPVYNLMEQFGEFLVPDLLLVYKKYVNPEWRTYDMLLNTEIAMHGAVRAQDSRTTPPVLLVTKQGSNQLLIDYYSKRKMSGVAVGIIKGIAAYYEESDMVTVTRLSPADEERVQIQVDFLK